MVKPNGHKTEAARASIKKEPKPIMKSEVKKETFTFKLEPEKSTEEGKHDTKNGEEKSGVPKKKTLWESYCTALRSYGLVPLKERLPDWVYDERKRSGDTTDDGLSSKVSKTEDGTGGKEETGETASATQEPPESSTPSQQNASKNTEKRSVPGDDLFVKELLKRFSKQK